MPKVKKLKRRKKFRANVNRKRLRNKLTKLPNIQCKQIKESWEVNQSTVKNLTQMGLAYDPNKVLSIPNVKEEWFKSLNDSNNTNSDTEENIDKPIPIKAHVVQSLEEEAKHPRVKLFRLPNNEVQFVTYMMDKYDNDYKGMVRDRKNYYQLTWRQIKGKIERFKNIPEQYAEYLVKKGEIILDDPTPLKKIKPEVLKESVEKKPSSKLSRRKRKKSKLVQSIWVEETIDQDKVIEDSENENVAESDVIISDCSNKEKLQLFSDDDNSETDEDMEDETNDSGSENDNNKEITLKKHVITNDKQNKKKLKQR